jgi:hypothetical protein
MKKCRCSDIARMLIVLRDAHHDQLRTGELSDLNGVINELLEAAESTKPEVALGDLADRALRVMASIIDLVNNFTDGF